MGGTAMLCCERILRVPTARRGIALGLDRVLSRMSMLTATHCLVVIEGQG
jgi:hypothetical protein